jgi:GTP-binding protein
VERCKVLLHLVDGTQEDVAEAYTVIRGELDAYANGLEDKPELIALSKADALSEDERAEKLAALGKASGQRPMLVSAATGEGVPQVLRAILRMVDGDSGVEEDFPTQEDAPWRP